MDRQRRYDWGFHAGVRARRRSHDRFSNPFVHAPDMPMRRAWFEGWDEADEHLRAEREFEITERPDD